MKPIFAAAAVALTVAAPAVAQNQLAADLGVNADNYTTAQLTELHFAQDENIGERNVYFGGDSTASVSTKTAVNPKAEAILEQVAYSDEPELTVEQELDTATVYQSGAVNARAAAIFAELDAED